MVSFLKPLLRKVEGLLTHLYRCSSRGCRTHVEGGASLGGKCHGNCQRFSST